MFCTVADGSDSVDLVEEIGRLMLLFRLHWPNDADQKHMDLALIRVMEKPNRNTGGSFPLMRAVKGACQGQIFTQTMACPNWETYGLGPGAMAAW